MHLGNNFTRGLRGFDVGFNLGGCLLHIADINIPKSILELVGRYLFKIRDTFGARHRGAGRPRKDRDPTPVDLVNQQLIRIGVTKKDTFDKDGNVVMTRKTGRDLRRIIWRLTFALLGVVGEEDGGGKIINLLIAFHKVRTLSDAAVASDAASVEALEASIAPFMDAYDLACRTVDEEGAKNIYAWKTLHQFSHFPAVVRYLGSLASTSSDQMERVHSFIKELFEGCTNGALEEETLMPQMIKAVVLRGCRPFPNASLVPGKAVARVYLEASLVAPQNLQTISSIILEGNETASTCQILVNFSLLLHMIHRAASQKVWTFVELSSLGISSVDSLKPLHFKFFRASLGSGLKCPAGWCHGGLGTRLSLLQLKTGRFVYFVCALKVVGLPSSMDGSKIWAFCKRLTPVIGQQWIDQRFDLPAVADSLPLDQPNSYQLVDPLEIAQVWSLVQVLGVTDDANDPQAFYGVDE